MTKFTPGPWKVSGNDICTKERCIIAQGRYVIGYQYGKDNASLIAATPDMYEALIPFARFACDLNDGEKCECFNCKAREALAKARGEK